MKDKKQPSRWKMLRDDLHADCGIFDVRKRSFRRESDGVQGEFFVLDTNDWVNVLALTKQMNLFWSANSDTGRKNFHLSFLVV